MKIAAISDIHGNLPALEAVLADIALQAVDVTVNLGDILSGPLWIAETADRLMAWGTRMRGNPARAPHSRPLPSLHEPDSRMGSRSPYRRDGLADLWLARRGICGLARCVLAGVAVQPVYPGHEERFQRTRR